MGVCASLEEATAPTPGSGRTLPDDKPPLPVVYARTLLPTTLQLDEGALAALPPALAAATREIRARVGRRRVAYPIPVGRWSVRKSLDWRPRPDDVVILTFHKTGTTWTQQICHQLRCGASPAAAEFKEITEVCPWIDFGWEIDQDLAAPQVAAPRLFKSHARLSAVHEGCNYLVTLRDPVRTLVSLYKFFVGKNAAQPFLPPSFLEGVDAFAACPVWVVDSVWGGHVWEYFVEFWACRDLPNVEVLAFEDMKQDLPREIRRCAAFLGVEADADVVARVADRASLAYMSKHDDQFSEGWFYDEQLRLGRYDAPPLPPVAKVNAVAPNAEPSAATLALMDDMWAKHVAPKTGLASYADMLARLRADRAAA